MRTDPTTTSQWRRLAIIGLIVFVVVDIVLVIWAVTASRTPRETSGAPAAAASAAGRVTASPTTPARPTATASSAPIPVADAVAPHRLLAVLSDTTAWRARTGACPATPAQTEVSTDGGATWKPSDASGPTGASAIVRLTVQSDRQASAVALSAQGCNPEFIRTYVAGDNWAAYPDQLGSAWYADPKDPGKVHTPTGDKAAPCATVIGLAVGAGGDAAVLCAGHDVRTTTDGGATWGAPRTVPGGVAITTSGSGYLVAAVGAAGCAGTSVVALDAGSGEPTQRACVGSTAPAPVDVAIAAGFGNDAVWLWAGDATTRSTDGGTTWR
ncbi:hypothetical protein [Leifsonia sp. NPDC080035]|uniref:Exo-alpha-sialidase n=1 Tax=Leifsonia sp. NPDC080035 TaxID=3143936 RepID=A0AAU7GDX6_9MICO